MIRLLNIEWLKLRKYKAFNILMILYYVVLVTVCSSGMAILEFLKSKGAEFQGFSPTILPIYDFPDIWQNLTYVATILNAFPAFLIIISITNEIQFKTLRQNIIDGLDRMDFFLSKFGFILLISIVNTLILLVNGMVLGLIYSYDTSFEAIFSHAGFLPAFFLNNLTFFMFAFLLSLLIRRTGIVIVLLGIYTYFAEPIATLILANVPEFPKFCKEIVAFFPIKGINNLIPNPIGKYAFMEITDFVPFKAVAIVFGQLALYTGLIWLLLKERDA
ncbi:MAG TPA: hypothetical protein VHO90_21235 [Bacteroidales bacterium]|nr:hypothetical protein [Bacteroidales bacterium]